MRIHDEFFPEFECMAEEVMHVLGEYLEFALTFFSSQFLIQQTTEQQRQHSPS